MIVFSPAKKPRSRRKKAPRPLKRGGRIARGKGVNPVNRKRRAKNQARSYGSKRDWIVSLPCHFCSYRAPSEPAHAKTGGMGHKSSSAFLIPMCSPHDVTPGLFVEGCHRESHRGVKTFEAKHGVTLVDVAAEYDREYQSRFGGAS